MKIILSLLLLLQIFMTSGPTALAQNRPDRNDNRSPSDEQGGERDDDDDSNPLPIPSVLPIPPLPLPPLPVELPIEEDNQGSDRPEEPTPPPRPSVPPKDVVIIITQPTPTPKPTPTPVPTPTPEPTLEPKPVAAFFRQDPPQPDPVSNLIDSVRVSDQTQDAAKSAYRNIVVPTLSFVSQTAPDEFYKNQSLPARTAFALGFLALTFLATGVAILRHETFSERFRRLTARRQFPFARQI